LEDKKYWNTTIKKYKKVKFNYYGFVSQSKLNKILGQSKVFLATHKVVEAFGNTSLEALASGTPVISYNLGGPAEVIEEGKSGYLIKPGQVAEIAKAVKKIDGLDSKQDENE
jgi:UDP-glucose:tetrahydrobiopterin glucosyltransferase